MRLFLILSLPVFLVNPAWANKFVINHYDISIKINSDSVLELTEKITVHFNQPQHGIIRKIPYSYQGNSQAKKIAERPNFLGKKYELLLDNISVIGKSFKTYKQDGNQFIQIGSPHRFESTDVTYWIRYRVYGAINFFPDHSELYWNLIGQDWNVPILQWKFNVEFPNVFEFSSKDYFVFTGIQGSVQQDVIVQTAERSIFGESVRRLEPHEGVSIGVKLPENYLSRGSNLLRFKFYVINNFSLLLPIFTFFCLFFFYLKSRSNKSLQVAFYPPKGMTSAEAGVLIDDTVDSRDLLSLIFAWGAQRIIEIEVVKNKGIFISSTDIVFTKKAELPENAKKFEKTIFNGMFSYGVNAISISALKGSFFPVLAQARNELSLYIDSKEYYEGNARNFPKIMRIGTTLASLFLFVIQSEYRKAGILSCIIIFVFSFFLKGRKTDRGSDLYETLRGFKEFIQRAGVPRLQKLIQEDPNYFDSTLPYAIAFGLGEQWAKRFDGLLQAPPQWYVQNDGSVFTFHEFSNSINSSLSTLNQNLTSSPASGPQGESAFSSSDGGSGGSSGGGFGGGGGDSW